LEQISSDHDGVTIKEFSHSWGQNSIIARFEPADISNKDAPVTIIGAHQDSTNQWPFLPAPYVLSDLINGAFPVSRTTLR
jgi:leucyl aminopeptidase